METLKAAGLFVIVTIKEGEICVTNGSETYYAQLDAVAAGPLNFDVGDAIILSLQHSVMTGRQYVSRISKTWQTIQTAE